MRKLCLHIGSHKTGTTTLQKALRQAQKAERLGPWTYVFAKDRVDFNRLVRCTGMGQKMMSNINWPFLERRTPEDGDNVISTEMLFWLDDLSEIEALGAKLRQSYDEIQIVAYLRRQDALALSHRKQVVMGRAAYQFYGAQLTALPTLRPDMASYFDYATKLRKWEAVFGEENVMVRRFQRKDLIGEDTVEDFFSILGVSVEAPPDRVNKAWSRAQLMAGLWLRQRGYPREAFLPEIHKIKDATRLMPTAAEAEAFFQTYSASNAALAERYDPQGPELFFESDFSSFPVESQGDVETLDVDLVALEVSVCKNMRAMKLQKELLNPKDSRTV